MSMRSVTAPILILLCACFTLCSCSVFTDICNSTNAGKLSGRFSEINEPDFVDFNVARLYYGELSENEQLAYRCIYNQIFEHPERIELPSVTEPELMNIFTALRYDNPFLLCLADTYNVYTVGMKYYFYPDYSCGKESCSEQTRQLISAAREITAQIPPSLSQFDKELFAHDYICEYCSYAESGEDAENAAGALLYNEALCSGYSKSCKLLLDMLGIDSMIVTGEATNSENVTMKHMWLAVNIDSKWYHLDITWDDPKTESDNSGEIRHTYFNVTDDEIRLTHKNFTLPQYIVCNSRESQYYSRCGLFCAAESDWREIVRNTVQGIAVNGDCMAEFRFADSRLMNEAVNELFLNGGIYKILSSVSEYTFIPIEHYLVTYSLCDDVNVLRINFGYQ